MVIVLCLNKPDSPIINVHASPHPLMRPFRYMWLDNNSLGFLSTLILLYSKSVY